MGIILSIQYILFLAACFCFYKSGYYGATKKYVERIEFVNEAISEFLNRDFDDVDGAKIWIGNVLKMPAELNENDIKWAKEKIKSLRNSY